MDLVELADDLKQRGMLLVQAAAPEWSGRAYVALARRQPSIHVDDMLRAFTDKPSHPNAWGAVWQRAIREHMIIRSERVRACTVDPTKHKHLYPVYMSLIYR